MGENYNLGEVIQTFRNEKGLSQEEVALRADITPAYLGQIEHGKKSPTIRIVERICSALDIPLADLFSNESMQIQNNTDPVSNQILAQISDCTEEEKKQLLSIIKGIIRFQRL